MLLTIGMATVRDYHGPYFTAQAIRLALRGFDDYELIFVDNDPKNEHGIALRQTVEKDMQRGYHGARYIPMGEAHGTTQPRQRIFDEARGAWVMVVDSHILFEPGALRRFVNWIADRPECADMLQGPILYDDLWNHSTHFDEVWRSEMWGTWGTDPRGEGDEPFPIWAQGLGMFAMRRTAFPGFDRRWRGFGGEEGCIHEVVRQQGGQVLCLPWLRWCHRWHKPGVSNYTPWTWHKVRNYVLGFQRLGRPLDEIHQHFVVERQNFSQREWDALLADPERENPPGVTLPVPAGPQQQEWRPSTASHLPQPPDSMLGDVRQLAKWVVAQPRDLNEHAELLGRHASGQHVVELTKRRESAAFLLAGMPASLVSFTSEPDPLYEAIHEAMRRGRTPEIKAYTSDRRDSLEATFDDCDVLYIDTIHHADRIYAELAMHGPKVRKRIIVRGTHAFGEHAETGGRGLYYGIHQWFSQESARGRDWVLIERADNQYGMAVYSCEPGAVALASGPGTELADILRSLGIVAGAGCDCKARQAQMDAWGVDGCREHRATILEWVTEGAPRWGWSEKLKAVALAVASGVAFSLSPTDPYGSLIDLAIDRAEAKAKRAAANSTRANAKGGAA